MNDQYFNFNVCNLAAVVYGPEDDVGTLLSGSQLPI